MIIDTSRVFVHYAIEPLSECGWESLNSTAKNVPPNIPKCIKKYINKKTQKEASSNSKRS